MHVAKATVADGGKITLTWDAPASGAPVTGYRIYEQNDLLSANWTVSVPNEEGKTSFSYTVENTNPNQTYQFVIKAVSDLQVVENTGVTPDFTKAAEFTGRSAVSRNSKDELVHKAEATGLKADTKYYFRVGDKALGLWSAVGTFETAAKT